MKRRYGQHFLNDQKIIERIVDSSGVGAGDAVLEIGPGRGVLTRALAPRVKKILAIEIDRHLFSELESAALPANVALRLGDALELSDEEIVRELGSSYSVVANLPYEITSELLQKFLRLSTPPKSMTVMVQKEVGERMTAKPGDVNRLALFCGYYSLPKVLFDVPPGAFSPPPKVNSSVVQLVLRPEPLLPPPAEALFFRLTEAAFAQKRRNLKNSITKILGPDTVRKLEESGIKPTARPEEIPLEDWLTLALKSC